MRRKTTTCLPPPRLRKPRRHGTPTPSPTPALGGLKALDEAIEVELSVFPDAEKAMRLSINKDQNELWTIRETDSAFEIEARRYGHGVGMSQRGAEWMAQSSTARATKRSSNSTIPAWS